MIVDSTRGADILIGQYKVDSELTTNKKSEQSIASKRRSGALTKQAFLPPLDECGRSAIDCFMREEPIEVRDLDALVALVDQDRVTVDWTVTSAIGPEWIGSTHKLSFYVAGIPIAENWLTQQLANALIEAISIPETSEEHVISGEGELRRRGHLIEVVYEWSSAIPYDWSSDSDSGVVTLFNIEND